MGRTFAEVLVENYDDVTLHETGRGRGRKIRKAERQEDTRPDGPAEFRAQVEAFSEFGKATRVLAFPAPDFNLPVYVNEFWTARQRAAHPLHEISYRACFKPQLPRFFITRLTRPGETVYDPFMGRGTTVLEAALLGRRPMGCDINPLSRILILPRLDPPELCEVRERLSGLDLARAVEAWDDLLVFYHPDTLRELINLRAHLLDRAASGSLDHVDAWIRMVATNRLTGHSPGFFSVYTLPPNQAVSLVSQRRINERRGQSPPRRDVRALILRKSRALLKGLSADEAARLRAAARDALLLTASCERTPQIADESVALVVTSPPFLDTVDYQGDNWLRCWFNGIEAAGVRVWKVSGLAQWQDRMRAVFQELHRILAPGGHVAFEVGEVRKGQVLLETLVVPAAASAGLTPLMVLVNDQVFTKTSHCWGVDNLRRGTNTNRIVVLRKPGMRIPRRGCPTGDSVASQAGGNGWLA